MPADGPWVVGEVLLRCLKQFWSRGVAFHADTNLDFICRCAFTDPEHQDSERVNGSGSHNRARRTGRFERKWLRRREDASYQYVTTTTVLW